MRPLLTRVDSAASEAAKGLPEVQARGLEETVNIIETHVKPLREQHNPPDADRQTWEHIVIENGYNEQRFICRGVWAGDTYFYVDAMGITYERYPSTPGEPETFEQLSSGDRWTMCDGYELNPISGELAERVSR